MAALHDVGDVSLGVNLLTILQDLHFVLLAGGLHVGVGLPLAGAGEELVVEQLVGQLPGLGAQLRHLGLEVSGSAGGLQFNFHHFLLQIKYKVIRMSKEM